MVRNAGPSTKAVCVESLGNPQGNVTDIACIAQIAHRHGVSRTVDNSVATPHLSRPFEHGADIVVHSLTKYLGGHGTSVGVAIVDSGQFPWARHKDRFKRLNAPDVSDNTLAVARHLKTHPKVGWVNYGGLQDHADHGLAKKYLSGEASAC